MIVVVVSAVLCFFYLKHRIRAKQAEAEAEAALPPELTSVDYDNFVTGIVESIPVPYTATDTETSRLSEIKSSPEVVAVSPPPYRA